MLTTASPLYGYLNCVAAHGERSLVPKWLTEALSGEPTQKRLDELARKYAEVAGRMHGEYL